MLSQVAGPVALVPSSTSYFSDPEDDLDPTLFDANRLDDRVRMWILHTVHSAFSESGFLHSETWTRVWLAGSGVSYQWSAGRSPADLDILLGINYVEFRRANPAYAAFTDSEIASTLNEMFYKEMHGPRGDFPFSGEVDYEVTVYVNRGVSAGRDAINIINPYAAYDVTQGEWAMVPQRTAPAINPSWEMSVERDRQYAEDLVREYGNALDAIRVASNPAHRSNAENRLHQIMDAADGLYDELHSGRRAAFSPAGSGYADFNNYRWQAGKRTGVVQATKRIREYLQAAKDRDDFETYGLDLPDTSTLIRRSMMHKAAPGR
jgi:hypothetical protein